MIVKHDSLKHADKVLTFVRSLARGMTMKFDLEVWSNGRMQGYFMKRSVGEPGEWPALVWSEYKTSDQTIVVYGTYLQFDVQTHQPQEKLWTPANQRFFYPDKDVDAAEFIVDYLAYFPLREFSRKAEAKA